MAEDKFEQAVIEKLKSEGWDYLSEYSGVTVDRLYDHWRDILNANNRKRLEDTPLSDNEFEQVKLELTKNKTPYDAQLMLAGAGGVGTVPLNRDDGTQLELEIFYGDEVAGGHSRYEVVNQITFTDLATSLSSKRRIDIMLLINGLPVAHIEEKDESLQNQWNAFEQFQKYDGDGMYTGLFSFVQVQFVLSQNSAHYFARPKNSHSYNRDFAFGWRDDDGKDVTNTMTFIHEVMGIPALHRLVTVNMIPDAANDNLMVMRSYQIQATRQILDRMREMDQNGLVEKEGGYVWHTTGSGKTVTSFKVAQLLASRPRVEAFQNSTKKQGYYAVSDPVLPNETFITYGFGHLVELATPETYDKKYKQWDLSNLPILPEKYKFIVPKDKKAQFKIVSDLLKEADQIIVATDSDREGENIAWSIMTKAQIDLKSKDIKRLWINSLEKETILHGFKNLKNGWEFYPAYQEAQTRQISDWLIGMNGRVIIKALSVFVNSKFPITLFVSSSNNNVWFCSLTFNISSFLRFILI